MPGSATRIRAVCVSDLHLAEGSSLLTHLNPDAEVEPGTPSPVAEQLIRCLKALMTGGGGRPTLILNGDILDLAYAPMGLALGVFERLLELLIQPGAELVSEIVYLPGNHDHHIWEIARETQYVNEVLRHHRDLDIPSPTHATPMSASDRVTSYLLNQLVRRVRSQPGQAQRRGPVDAPIYVVYPNLALTDPGRDRAVVFHHGHYTEPLYHAVTKARQALFVGSPAPQTVHALEAENFAWIDFVWSVLGRSGMAGEEIGRLFRKLYHPAQLEAFIDESSRRLAEAVDLPWVPGDWLEKVVLEKLMTKTARLATGGRAFADSEGLASYLNGPVKAQLRSELGAVPSELTFVMGHTHEPLEVEVDGSLVYNSGGWTVDGLEADPERGAAVILVGDGLEVASLRVWPEVRVSVLPGAARDCWDFAAGIEARLAETRAEWSTFEAVSGRETERRRQRLAALWAES